MKKGQVLNLTGNCLVFSLAFLLILLSACSRNKINDHAKLEDIDTISLPFKNPQAWKIYYHPLFDKSILTFINESPLEIVIIDPEELSYVTFPLDKVVSQFQNLSYPLAHYVIDSSSVIVNFLNMKDKFFKIDRKGEILSIIQVEDQRQIQEYGIYYYTTLIPYPNQDSDTIKLVENFTADFPGNHLYITDKSIRNRKFSAGTNILIKYYDTIMIVSEEIGVYPPELHNSPDYYYYEPSFCISDNNRVISIFPSINKIGQTLSKTTTEFIGLTIPGTKAVEIFNVESVMNYNYINKYTYENSILRSIKSDFKDSCYYLISSIESKYINDDGTVNEPSASPWVLVTMDKSLKIIRTDYFDKGDLSKHNFFFSSKFWFIQSKTLTNKHPDKFLTFIKFKKPE